MGKTKATVRVMFGVVFVTIGLWLFVWDIGMIRKARASRSWPRVVGIVTSAEVGRHRGQAAPHVVYDYTVEGVTYTSHQISFDVFDKPGGKGFAHSIVSRYPIGGKVDVYVDPNDPTTAIIEPEVYSPFYAPLLFASISVIAGLWCVASNVMARIGG